MRVENPKARGGGEVWCEECPLQNSGLALCVKWMSAHKGKCPTVKTYQSACLMAEEAAKGGKE